VHVVEAGAGPAVSLLLLHQTPRSVDEFVATEAPAEWAAPCSTTSKDRPES
jgi:hypothetical protein